jgi:HK97 family phage prohead protease
MRHGARSGKGGPSLLAPLHKVTPLNAPAEFSGQTLKLPPLGDMRLKARGAFEGYASLFGVEDQGRDVVMPGAFRASLDRRGTHDIRMLFQHDPAQPIGLWDDISEDARGLHVRGHLIEDVARARELLALMRAGALDGLSIGFRARRATRDARTGQRRLHEIDLWEISIVTFPMLPGARVNGIKASATAALMRSGHFPAKHVAAQSEDGCHVASRKGNGRANR